MRTTPLGAAARSAARKPIGVGIVGLSAAGGRAGKAHVPALSALDGIELRALSVSSAASARAAGEAFGVPAYASAAQLAQADEVDLVVVAVKVPQHRELVLPALEAGVPVLSEWPLAVDLREAQELHRAARGTRTFVGLQGRSAPVFRWLADLVSNGYVGEVLSALTLPDGRDDLPHLAEAPFHALAHAYAAIRDDLVHDTAVAPDFAHAVKRHRLLDAIERSAATGRRVDVP